MLHEAGAVRHSLQTVKIAAILKDEGDNVTYAKIDAPEERELIAEYDVQVFPTLNAQTRERRSHTKDSLALTH